MSAFHPENNEPEKPHRYMLTQEASLLRERIALLEEVAEAAVATCRELGRYGADTESDLFFALHAAGYYRSKGNE